MKKISPISLFLITLILQVLFTRCGTQQKAEVVTSLEIKDGWYYVNGEKFFVNALGYEIGARPGQHPYVERYSEPERVKHDMKVIKEAGFNAIRTWSELTEEELQMVQESGLKVVFGIGFNPALDFSDPKVIDEFMGIAKKVINYSKNYDCIITYLIMNEPMPEHIRNVGAQATVDLWKKIRDYIHQEHPGIPVTISGNSAITEFVDMNIFDIYAYNAYDYDGFNYTHGYANAAGILPEMNKQGKPLLLTEFGFSVSRQGGEERYGGNTLIEQMEILPWYYRQLLDAGASGACPFYYADGWWKGGEPEKHNDTPEEWFGFWGYQTLEDTVGYPRPVWHKMKEYNTALISSPKNQTFYKNIIPLEVFLQPDVKSIRVIYQDNIIFSKTKIENQYLSDSFSFDEENLTDRELIFEFYDKNNNLLKLESIIVLTGKNEIDWPSITLFTEMQNLNDGKQITVEYKLSNNPIFTLSGEVRYLFSTHIGWSRGEQRRWEINSNENVLRKTDSYSIPAESPVLGLYAGTEIKFGKFVKTIYDQKLIYRGNWADPIRIK
ncbi:MAG: hypothetical protein K9J12_02645 [Melioribacteraceae bacterium]|nr:hypothetical protein [Melioribacteraceae bacterium]MCF8265736.1 hypothetical protein [Melioribacteraceae bacterium]MCF8432413.1 hypothetical protein [Melioribacteraceae bacterium]